MTTIKIGDSVHFKYDIEQSGKVERIEKRDGRNVYFVRAFHGGYVDNNRGTIVELSDEDLF